uniref:DEUBAD domain-containing protein n=1 Tax=Oncorhynchus tshawytscha TaxID=74940 RepID=A0A8C8MDK6_ONCTS
MDVLDHMLTDPLDSEKANDGHITEECMLGDCRVSLPEDLLEDPEIFFAVLSESTWSKVQTDEQRQHLRQLLPQFPDDSTSEQDGTISDLFNNQNFCFGNPLHHAQKLFGGNTPHLSQTAPLLLQQYYHKLLKQILVSRKLAVRSGPDIAVKRKCPARTPGEMQEQRVRGRVCWILREVKTECGDRYPSSDDDGTASSLPTPRSPSSPTPTVFVRVLSSLSTQDMKTTAKPELGEKDMRAMLRRHREKRRRQPDHPDLMTSDIHLGDLMSRVDVGRKVAMMALLGLARPKRKMRRKKMRRIKVESEDPCQALMPSEAPALSLDIPAALPDTPVPPLPSVKEEPLGEVQNNPVMAEEIAVTFFNLLENILRLEGLASTAMLEEKVRQWQTSPASSLNPRFSSASCWSEMVLPALHFLAGETKVGMMALPSGFTPCVVFRESPSENGEKDLSALCQLWVDSKGLVVVKAECDELAEITSPTPRAWTDYVVRASTGDERHVFQVQEQQRYDQPHKAFTFRMHGFESQVGPVKGVFDKEMSLNKAREHTLLRSDRPAYVTILSLVRDAAARLPNGEGTRAEICELLKDSPFLAPDVTSAQVNMVVSGALDRLHYEKDPCVTYDIVQAMLFFPRPEKIHQAQAAAAKARKTLQQKPKLASKPVSPTASTLKEGGGKTSGGLEASHMGGPMSPTPSTLGTPKSPLAPVATTPTKAGIPDLVKTGPGTNALFSSLLVSPPPIPQLGTLLSSSQCGPQVSQPAISQHSARVVGHQSGSPPRVRVVSAQAAKGQQAMLVHQTPRQIRVPVTVGVKGITQTVVSLPLRTLSFGSPIQGQAARGQTTLSMSGLTTAQTGFPGSPAHHTASPAVLQGVTSQGVTSQNIIQQVVITGQMGVKAQGGAAISIPATDLRIQGKDVLRLPPYSITTDSKGQTVLRITPEMMATLTKSPVTTTKLTPDMLGTATTKSISATLHLTPTQHSSPCIPASSSGGILTNKASAGTTTLLKAAGDAMRLMPTLAVAMAEQKARTFSTVSSSDSNSGTPIRIMPRLGVIPQKLGQAITVTTTTGSKPVSTGAATVPKATSGVAVAEGVTIGPSASGSLTLGTATATVRQVPVTATVVSTQPRKLPARIPVPLSVLSQPLKSKSGMTTPILKGNISTNLGRNIILTTMPAGTKLIAGNKPVSFVTAHQLLQQQGQTTQVRIQTVPALQLQQLSAAGSPKSVSAAVVTTAPSPKRTPDPPPPAQ